jgi:hypothetical protein
MNTDELVGEEDIEAALEAPVNKSRSRAGSSSSRGDSAGGGKGRSATPPEGKQAAASLLRSDSLMSARERNKLKRKAKQLGRQDSTKPCGLDAKGRVSSSTVLMTALHVAGVRAGALLDKMQPQHLQDEMQLQPLRVFVLTQHLQDDCSCSCCGPG